MRLFLGQPAALAAFAAALACLAALLVLTSPAYREHELRQPATTTNVAPR